MANEEVDAAAGFFDMGAVTSNAVTYNDGSELVFEGSRVSICSLVPGSVHCLRKKSEHRFTRAVQLMSIIINGVLMAIGPGQTNGPLSFKVNV